MRIAVIGGSGFLGSSVADELSKQGNEVLILDQSESEWLTADQQYLKVDILNLKNLLDCLKGIDYVYNFAGIADIGESKEIPIETLTLNIIGAANIAEACVKNNVKRLLYASTLYVFNNKGSFYGTSKRSAELIIRNYHEEFSLDFNFLRYGSLYGPRAQEWNGINRFISEALNKKKITYHGTGKEIREYIHISDAVRLSVDILSEEYKNEALTITGTQTLSSTELFQMIFEICGMEEKIDFVNNEKQDHYKITPYSFSPISSKKITSPVYKDLGEGILEIIRELDSK